MTQNNIFSSMLESIDFVQNKSPKWRLIKCACDHQTTLENFGYNGRRLKSPKYNPNDIKIWALGLRHESRQIYAFS